MNNNSLRKNQILELAVLREDEKLKLLREKELELENFKITYEHKEKTVLDQINKVKEIQREEFNNEIKMIMNNSSEKCHKLHQMISSLEENVFDLKEENKRIRQNNEQQMQELLTRYDDEKSSLKKQHQIQIMVFEK